MKKCNYVPGRLDYVFGATVLYQYEYGLTMNEEIMIINNPHKQKAGSDIPGMNL